MASMPRIAADALGDRTFDVMLEFSGFISARGLDIPCTSLPNRMPVRRGRLLAPDGPETKRHDFGENAGTKRLDRSFVGLRPPADVHVRNTIGQNMLQKRMSTGPLSVPFLARSMLRGKRMEWKMENIPERSSTSCLN